jgi:hypothetical protein
MRETTGPAAPRHTTAAEIAVKKGPILSFEFLTYFATATG